MLTEPKNEQRVCEEIIRIIGERDGRPMTITGRPDQTERQEEAVELLFTSPTKQYAMEHTRIESFSEPSPRRQKSYLLE